MQAWTPVKVNNPDLELHGHAGICQGVPALPKGGKEGDEVVTVKMDATEDLVEFKVSDLIALA